MKTLLIKLLEDVKRGSHVGDDLGKVQAKMYRRDELEVSTELEALPFHLPRHSVPTITIPLLPSHHLVADVDELGLRLSLG
jgi:hypothetical protein